MSVLKLELKEEHLKLLKFLRWSVKDNVIQGISNDEDSVPFGENSIYEAIDLILNGKGDLNPFTTEDLPEYSDDQKAEWDELYADLPLALEIILSNATFELGTYKTKWHFRDWKKIK